MKKVKLIDAPVGLFLYEDTLCLKTEYMHKSFKQTTPRVEAYIVDSGETFWGGVKTAEEVNSLMVTPLDYKLKNDEAVLSEPAEDVESENPPKIKTKYQYYIAYKFKKRGDLTFGFGNAKLIRDSKISTFEDIEEIHRTIEDANDWIWVGLTNFIELDPITVEEDGED